MCVMKSLIFAFYVLFTVSGLCAETPSWQPSPGHRQVPIWPGSVPDAQPAAGPEDMKPVDFAVALYPGHLWVNEDRKPSPEGDKKFELRPDIHVTRQTPPTFLLQAENDYVDGINQSLVYYIALKNADVPVEMHLYAQGGHAFGLRPAKFPITRWPELVETWLRTIGMISE
jgi:acetyl esterase/lipase